MINDLTAKQCPCVELLSIYCDCADPENDVQMTAISRHVDNCRACQKILAAYRQVDQLVTSACQPSVDFTERILAAVSVPTSTSASTPSAWHPPWQRLLQVAAAVIFLALAVAVLLRSGKPGVSTDDIVAVAPSSEGGQVNVRIVDDSVLGSAEQIAGAGQVGRDKSDEYQAGRRVQ